MSSGNSSSRGRPARASMYTAWRAARAALPDAEVTTTLLRGVSGAGGARAGAPRRPWLPVLTGDRPTKRVALAAVALAAFAGAGFWSATRLELRSASAAVIVVTAAAVIEIVAALLFADRFRRYRRTRDLLLAAGLTTDFGASLLTTIMVDRSLAPLGHSPEWIALGGRLVGWSLVAAAVLAHDRPLVAVSARRIWRLILCGILLGLLGMVALYATPETVPLLAAVAVHAALALVMLVAAIGARPSALAAGDATGYALRAACGLAAAAAIAACASPLIYADRVESADILHLGWSIALLGYLCLEWSADERIGWLRRIERERQRLAADIHDLVMQDLSFALASARMIAQDSDQTGSRGQQMSLTPDAPSGPEGVVLAGERALHGARRLVRELIVGDEERLPIGAAVRQCALAAARTTRLKVRFAGIDGRAPSEAARAVLLHLTREAVTNAVKHGAPRLIEIVLTHGRIGGWRLLIRDDGCGFDRQELCEGFGIRSMREQAEALGGKRRLHRGGGAPAVKEPRVVIADDHALVRLGIRMALVRGSMHVVAEAADRDGAIAAVLRESPDICLLDLFMPGGGIEAAAVIAQTAPATAVVMLTVAASPDIMLAAVRAGARGFLVKDTSPDRLPAALRGVLRGEAALPRSVLGGALTQLRELADRTPSPLRVGDVRLSTRESEVLRMLRAGLSTTEIGERLALSPTTVRRHISTAASKLGAANRQEALRALA